MGAPEIEITHQGPELGQRLRSGREAAGWSRTDVMNMTGISVAKVARIEIKGTGTEEELSAYRSVLMGALGEALGASDDPIPPPPKKGKAKVETRSPSVSGHFSDGSVRTTHWMGLERGDTVELLGEGKKKFRFLYHHQYPDDRGDYVEVSGPLVRYNGGIHGTQCRSVRPDRVKIHNKRR